MKTLLLLSVLLQATKTTVTRAPSGATELDYITAMKPSGGVITVQCRGCGYDNATNIETSFDCLTVSITMPTATYGSQTGAVTANQCLAAYVTAAGY